MRLRHNELNRYAFVIGLILTMTVGMASGWVRNNGHELLETIVYVGATTSAFMLYPERFRITSTGGMLGAAGVVLGGFFFFLIYRHVRLEYASPEALFGFLVLSALVIPVFEEKVVRQIMLDGARKRIGPYAGSLLCSLLFAGSHHGARLVFLVAFFISLVLCAMAIKGVDTIQRSMFHGAYNLSLLAFEAFYK